MDVNEERGLQDLINGSSENRAMLAEDALRQLSKSMTKLIPSNVDSLENGAFMHIRSTLQDLLQTASTPNLSLTHGLAALSALCGFLEQCSVSSDLHIQSLAYNTGTWTKAFNIYLTQSDNNRSKPLRRLLLTLTRLISKHPVDKEKSLLLEFSTCIATRAICKQGEFANIKPAIQALEHFINTGIINAADVAQVKWPEDLGLSRSTSTKMDGRIPDTQQEQTNRSGQRFALSILEWIQYPDCAPAVGRFLPVFFKSLDKSQGLDAVRTSTARVTPLWISPVKQSLERHQDLLDVFEIHVLPGLLRLGPADVKAFLKMLPFESIRCGNIGSSSVLDIHLCLLVAKQAEDPTFSKCFGQEQRTTLEWESLGISLLEHLSPSVRMTALSLSVSSSAAARPFRRRVLRCVRQSIPFLHAEVNTKPRNEFVALIKKLCLRLRSATLSLLRHGQDSDSLVREQGSFATPFDARLDGEGLGSSGNATDQVLNEELQVIEEHLAFRRWYMVFLLQQLRPTATYQSHITALKVLDFLTEQTIALRTTSSKSHNDYFGALDEHLPRGLFLRPLTDLLLDPFDDVRQSANRVLDLLLSTNNISRIKGGLSSELVSMDQMAKDQSDTDDDYCKANHSILLDLNKAESRAGLTGRADHADGFGRLYNLLFTTSGFQNKPACWHQSRYLILDQIISTLEKEVNIARNDLLFAVGNIPLHGHLIALKYIVSRVDYVESLDKSLEKWSDIDQRIRVVCSGVWELVRDVLCSDAPEGHDISEDDFTEQDIGSKDTLSFCWRALKESSLLMHAMITNVGYVPPSLHESTEYQGYHLFGDQAFIQLAELRHRGAFSTVSHTFAACCLKCAHSSQLAFHGYPQTWYKLTLRIIQDKSSSLTRRSAGIPAIMTGILAAYPGEDFFDDVIINLQAMANAPIEADRGSLPQVHVLNCLKEIFTDARFGPSTELYVAETLDIAASCLESQIWNIRNCGLMLFKALLKRLNGGTDTSSSKVSSSHRRFSQLTYEKYPHLPDLLLRLLRRTPVQTSVTGNEVHATMQAHRVFPALEVIERSGIPSQQKSLFLDALRYYNESPDWSIREKAAKALSLIVDENCFVEEVMRLLARDWKTQNALHGRLLRLRFLLARNAAPLFGELLSAYEAIVPILQDSFEVLVIRNSCAITAATFLHIFADLCVLLVVSNSEQAESFMVPVLAIKQDIMAKYSVLELQKGPLRRCIALTEYVHNLKSRPLRSASPDTTSHLSRADIDALQVVNVALQNRSDENDLAILRFCSARELRWASDITQFSPNDVQTASKNRRQSDYALALQGYVLGERFAFNTTNNEIQAWVRQLSAAGAERSDLRTRTASVFSIRAFFDSLLDHNFQLKSDLQLLGVFLVLYDSLVDDDEDVRDQGARVVSTILSVTTSPAANKDFTSLSLSPPAAKKRWLRFLWEGYQSSILLRMESIRRLTGMGLALDSASADMQVNEPQTREGKSVLRLRPVVELSLEARKTSMVVFVEESQNLYIDTVSEAEDWAELLCRLAPGAWSSNLLSELDTWTKEGLAHILDVVQNSPDGALSSTSKPKVFALFTRVLLSAKVLIMRCGQLVSSNGKGKGHVYVGLLEEILELGRSRLFHDLLLYRIEVILGEVGLSVPESEVVAAAKG